MILDHVRKRQVQPSISFGDLRKLIDLLSSTKNQAMVQKQK